MKKYYLIFVVIATLLISCEKETALQVEPTDSNTAISIDGIEVRSENGYLVLNSFEDADLLSSYLGCMSEEEVIAFNKSHNFNSAYTYRLIQNERRIKTNDETTIFAIVQELKTKGYFDEEQSSLTYPFVNIKWATILNEDGVIMIDKQLQRFIGADQIVSNCNDINELLSIKTKDDFSKYNVEVFTQPLMSLKSISIPKNVGATNLFGYVFESINTVGGTDYRRKTYLISYIYASKQIFPTRYFVEGYTIYITHELSQKIAGIWWDYKDYLYYKQFDITIGGNPISTNNSLSLGNHAFIDQHNSNPPTSGGVYQKSSHGYYILNKPWLIQAYTLNIDDFNTPNFDQMTYEYWTNKIPERSWMVF